MPGTWLHYDNLKVKVIQLCTTLCDPVDCSLPGSPVHGILQARTLENGNTWLPFSSPRDLPDPGVEPRSPALQAYSLPSEPPGKPYILTLTFSQFFIFWGEEGLQLISQASHIAHCNVGPAGHSPRDHSTCGYMHRFHSN